MTELKPCPFCGCGKIEITRKGNTHTKTRSVTIMCKGCAAKRITKVIRHSLEWCEEKAIEAWNTRPSPWLPIEQAPKDGTQILAFGCPEGTNTPESVIVYWHGNIKKGYWRIAHDSEGYRDWMEYCTHFIPIPEPPERKE